jgi:hypothetical protein
MSHSVLLPFQDCLDLLECAMDQCTWASLLCVCVRACARVCVRVCASASERERMHAHTYAHTYVASLGGVSVFIYCTDTIYQTSFGVQIIKKL